MYGNPFKGLLHSRKFWLLMLDSVVSALVYFVGKYAIPSIADDIFFLIGLMQPVFVVIIGAIAYEDGQQKRQG